MALITDISITIDSNPFSARVRHLSISQSIFKHHHFFAEFELASLEGNLDHFLVDSSRDYIGSVIQVSITPLEFVKQFSDLNFKGIITNVSGTRANRRNGDTLILQGYSPDILIDEAPNCRSFEKNTLKQIFTEVLKPYPSNLLPLSNSPKSTEKLEYTVQYNETNFNFLSRIASNNGEWFYYDGMELNLGHSAGQEVEMEYGSDLVDFNFSLGVSPINFASSAYNYNDAKTYTGKSKSQSVSGLNENQKVVEKQSNSLYTNVNTDFNHGQPFTITQSVLDKAVKRAKGEKINSSIVCKGQSENTSVQIGQIINISGKNLVMEAGPTYGKYIVVGVEHSCDLEGNYMNTFTAIPSTVGENPYVAKIPIPVIETQSAVVTDVNDTEKLGRVRVRFHWQTAQDQSPWLRIVNPYAAKSRGAYIIPELNDEVMVGFEGNNAEKPYVMGSLYNGKAKPDAAWADAKNNTKAFRTRSGHTVVFSDKEGKESITIHDKENKNSIELDTSKEKLTIYSKGDIAIQGKNIELSAKADIKLLADGGITEKAKKAISLEATKDVNLKATGKITQKATQDLSAEGLNVKIKGTIAAKISGAQAELAGSAMTTVKGALVKIN